MDLRNLYIVISLVFVIVYTLYLVFLNKKRDSEALLRGTMFFIVWIIFLLVVFYDQTNKGFTHLRFGIVSGMIVFFLVFFIFE